MKEPYREGVANHSNPESCAGDRKAAGEALTGAHAGQPSSSEITSSACRPCARGRPHVRRRQSRVVCRRCGVEDPEHAWKLHAREPGDPGDSRAEGAGRSEKANAVRRTCMFPGSRGPIVPEKRANKAGPTAAAESVEGRGPTKGNETQALLAADTVPGKRGPGMRCVRTA